MAGGGPREARQERVAPALPPPAATPIPSRIAVVSCTSVSGSASPRRIAELSSSSPLCATVFPWQEGLEVVVVGPDGRKLVQVPVPQPGSEGSSHSRLELEPPDGEWPEGSYEVVLKLGGQDLWRWHLQVVSPSDARPQPQETDAEE